MGEIQNKRRICKKCLIRETDQAKFFQNMFTYIANISEDDKTPDALYEERLAACKGCDQLLEGMCRICGCYVEMRAAMKKNYCPAFEPKW